MPAAVTSAFGRLRAAVSSFSLAQRTIAIIGIAVLVMGAVALSSWLSRPAMSPLFSGLGAEDASAVVEQLRAASVPYELADGGSTVLVAEADVYEQRLAAAASGLPRARTDGYSLFDTMGVTSSEFQQSVTYKRAIEGELARTIGALDNVTTASVQLAIPEESVFVSEKVDPTASVFIETANSTTLSTEQVEAIVHLTSAAVSGMKPEDVAVIDSTGRTLSAVGGDLTRGTDQQAGAYEVRTAANVQDLLDTVVGAGHATVSVSAVMEHATSERIDETYVPVEGAPPATEETSSETYTGTGADPGVLGAEVAAGAGDGGTYESTQATRTNVINKSVESTTTPAGALTRQTVAVAVDAAAAEGLDVDQLTALVTTAAGIDPDRGDAVTVEVVPFSAAAATDAQAALEAAREAEAAERAAETTRIAVIAGAVLFAVVVGIVTLVVVNRRRRRAAESRVLTLTPVSEPLDAFDAMTQGLPTPQLDPITPDLLATAALEPDPEPELSQVTLDRRRAEIGDFARRDPAKAADLLRQLVRDRQDA
ncbi:MAG: flagellar basal-body MS-ring/collar protein FliF [Candidatus Microbacterium phytovorans]|uniref:Flagellar M-ring protein n=1 Tax=Candidatus Microbacterium phytovorans TaxID=3121374 RepID=A0AAJ5VZQ6_9MICO|nr:flagellar basal-body MS-ring/collar protein FliF [Microbacterium sp.]WEK13062.1 MAG: flagellar basal-body MS-ring/collar protein FliF [Microbacterium sp.]